MSTATVCKAPRRAPWAVVRLLRLQRWPWLWAGLARVASVVVTALATLLAAGLPAVAQAAVAEARHALVVGNGSYPGMSLSNPGNDAQAVAKALQRAGFQVDLRINANQRQMDEALRAFGDTLRDKGVGLFYYAGHGVQIKGHNYLLPAGAEIKREDEVPFKATDVQQVLDKMEAAKNRLNVVILDACRDNPFVRATRSTASAGLSQIDAPIGSLIAFATAPGSVASDGKGANGLYTQHLLANLERPGLPIEEVFKLTRLGVRIDSNGQQVPWESTSLEGDFYFFPGEPGAAKAAAAPGTLPPPPALEYVLRTEQGYELLRKRRYDEAEKLFRNLSDNPGADVAMMGREGLAELLLQRGDLRGALEAANAIISRAPARTAAYLIRGRAMLNQGQPAEGVSSLQLAAGPRTQADFSWQKADALVAVGNVERKADPQAAAQHYQQALREQPQSVAALSNLAVVMNQGGQGAKAKALLERAQALDPSDAMTAALLRQVRESLADEQDRARQQYVDDAVKDLAARFRAGAASSGKGAAPADDWTSPLMAISVLPFQDLTVDVLGGRIGFDALLQQALVAELQQRGYTLVERRLLDKVLAEVKLGSSELADADTQIRLGRVLAARLMVSGQLLPGGGGGGGAAGAGGGLSAALRAIDTETTQLALVKTEPAGPGADGAADARRLAATLAQAVARTVAERYPLKGRIAAVDGERVVLNLGKRHGVASGQQFNVLLRGAPIELNGKLLGYQETRIAQLQVTEVEEGLAYARIAQHSAPLEKNQRVIARSRP